MVETKMLRDIIIKLVIPLAVIAIIAIGVMTLLPSIYGVRPPVNVSTNEALGSMMGQGMDPKQACAFDKTAYLKPDPALDPGLSTDQQLQWLNSSVLGPCYSCSSCDYNKDKCDSCGTCEVSLDKNASGTFKPCEACSNDTGVWKCQFCINPNPSENNFCQEVKAAIREYFATGKTATVLEWPRDRRVMDCDNCTDTSGNWSCDNCSAVRSPGTFIECDYCEGTAKANSFCESCVNSSASISPPEPLDLMDMLKKCKSEPITMPIPDGEHEICYFNGTKSVAAEMRPQTIFECKTNSANNTLCSGCDYITESAIGFKTGQYCASGQTLELPYKYYVNSIRGVVYNGPEAVPYYNENYIGIGDNRYFFLCKNYCPESWEFWSGSTTFKTITDDGGYKTLCSIKEKNGPIADTDWCLLGVVDDTQWPNGDNTSKGFYFEYGGYLSKVEGRLCDGKHVCTKKPDIRYGLPSEYITTPTIDGLYLSFDVERGNTYCLCDYDNPERYGLYFDYGVWETQPGHTKLNLGNVQSGANGQCEYNLYYCSEPSFGESLDDVTMQIFNSLSKWNPEEAHHVYRMTAYPEGRPTNITSYNYVEFELDRPYHAKDVAAAIRTGYDLWAEGINAYINSPLDWLNLDGSVGSAYGDWTISPGDVPWPDCFGTWPSAYEEMPGIDKYIFYSCPNSICNGTLRVYFDMSYMIESYYDSSRSPLTPIIRFCSEGGGSMAEDIESDVAVQSINLPSLYAGSTSDVVVMVSSTKSASAAVDLTVDGTSLGAQTVSVEGPALVHFSWTPSDAKSYELAASVSATGDTKTQNNMMKRIATVVKAVKLSVTASTACSSSVAKDTAFSCSATVSNTGDIDAANIPILLAFVNTTATSNGCTVSTNAKDTTIQTLAHGATSSAYTFNAKCTVAGDYNWSFVASTIGTLQSFTTTPTKITITS